MLTSSRLLILFFSLFSFNAFSQYQIGLIPRISPDKTVSAKLNYTDIKITYGSPKVKGRKIWGGIVPYDKVWRAGANSATTFEVSHDLYIDNQLLSKGKYSLFVIPTEDEKWSVIFNSIHKQWGSFDYDEKENALIVFSSPTPAPFNEELKYEIEDLGLGKGKISIHWENIQLSLPINTSFIDQLKTQVETKGDTLTNGLNFMPYLQGAQHLINNSDEIELAEKWINKSNSMDKSKSSCKEK